MRSIITLSAVFLIIAYAKADQEKVDGVTYTYDVRCGEAIIANDGYYAAASSHKKARGSLKIPSTLGGYSVTGIDAYAFSECEGLTGVVIPNSVTYIGKRAFYKCSGLTSVVISPSKGLKVCEDAFDTCPYSANKLIAVGTTDLAAWCEIDFEKVNANPLFRIEKFYAPNLVKNLIVPDGVEEIKPYVFSCYTNLTTVTISSSVKSIGKRAFYDCSGLRSVAIPNSVTNIGKRAFYRSGLTSITIPDSVTSIQEGTFEDCSGLGSVVIPKSVRRIEKEAFAKCSCTIHISDLAAWCRIEFHGDSFGSIPFKKLFLNGDRVEELVIPSSVTSVEGGAFSHCYGLASVTIPNSVTNIYGAFAECSDLKSVHISDLAVWCRIGGGGGFSRRYSAPEYNLYLNGELITDLIVPDSVTDIADSAFAHCSLTSVTIPNSVTNIGSFAFAGCKGLKWCVIPSSVKSIGSYAFTHCSSLSAVYYLCPVL